MARRRSRGSKVSRKRSKVSRKRSKVSRNNRTRKSRNLRKNKIGGQLRDEDEEYLSEILQGVDQSFLNSEPPQKNKTVKELLTNVFSHMRNGGTAMDMSHLLQSILDHAIDSRLDVENSDNKRFFETITNLKDGVRLRHELLHGSER